MSRSVDGEYPSPFGLLEFCPPPSVVRCAEKPWALVGLSGCGKSSLARALAASTAIEALDSDKLVEEQEGMTVVELFARKGEDYFRKVERAILRRLARDWAQGQRKLFVVASGGGAMAHAATRKVLKDAFTTVWLDCPLPVLARRLEAAQDRPLLRGQGQSIAVRLAEMLEKRKKSYAQAHARLIVSEKESIADLVARLKEPAESRSVARARVAEESSSSMCESIRIDLPAESYEVVVGAKLFERDLSPLQERVGLGKVILVAERVLAAYAEILRQSLQTQGRVVAVVFVSVSEQQKRLRSVEKLCQRFAEVGADRQSFVIILGGGVLCDLAAFSASVFMRGIPFAFFPTTLLAQVDAAIGGKNGVNSALGKNMLGVFRQPAAVICDTDSLTSLPEREMRCGYAEILKCAMIADKSFFAWLETHALRLLARESRVLRQAIVHSVRIKAHLVQQDEQERSGERALLNFGHTFAHALERLSLYRVAHGEAVAVGCVLATRLAVSTGRCALAVAERLEAHMKICGLPANLASLGISITRLQQLRLAERWVEAMSQDKKQHMGAVRLVLPSRIGACALQAPMELQSLRTHLAPILQDLTQDVV